MAEILPRDLNPAASVNPNSAIIVDDGNVVGKATPLQVVDSARPKASQVEAEAGADNEKIMTPLRVKQAIDAQALSREFISSNDPGEGASAIGMEGAGSIQDAINVADDPASLLASVATYPEGSLLRTADGFSYRVAPSGAGDAHLETAGGVKLYVQQGANGYDVRAFGARLDGLTDYTALITAMPRPIWLPEGLLVVKQGLDTADVRGPGRLTTYVGSPNIADASLRKSGDYGRIRFPFEDEFGPHATTPQGDLYYTSFGSSCFVNGKEVHVARTAYEHISNFGYPSVVHLYILNKADSITQMEKVEVYRTDTSADIRDVNVSPFPDVMQGLVLISFAEKTSGGDYRTRLIVYNVITKSLVSNRLISGPLVSDFKWGNVLLDSAKRLIFSTYSTDGTAIKLWRSQNEFTISGDITCNVAKTFSGTWLSEPTIGYWKDRLVLVARRTGEEGGSARRSVIYYTYDRTGTGDWSSAITPGSVQGHAPAVPAYSDASVWTCLFSMGSSRNYIAAWSSRSLRQDKYKFSYPVRITYPTGFGGYPSILDIGGRYVTTMFSEVWDPGLSQLRGRWDRLELDKGNIDITPADYEWVQIADQQDTAPSGSDGLWIGNPYGAGTPLYTSNGDLWSIEIEPKFPISVSSIALMTKGSGAASLTIVDPDDSDIGTSESETLTGTPTVMIFTFSSPVSLKAAQRYRIRINGGMNIYANRGLDWKTAEFETPSLIYGRMFTGSLSEVRGGRMPIALRIS